MMCWWSSLVGRAEGGDSQPRYLIVKKVDLNVDLNVDQEKREEERGLLSVAAAE